MLPQSTSYLLPSSLTPTGGYWLLNELVRYSVSFIEEQNLPVWYCTVPFGDSSSLLPPL